MRRTEPTISPLKNSKIMPWIKKAPPRPRRSRRDTLRRKEAAEIYNRQAWKRLRAATIARLPLCVMCLCRVDHPVMRLAEEVHHLRPISGGRCDDDRRQLAYDPGNLCPLCRGCHRTLHNEGLKGLDVEGFNTILAALHTGADAETLSALAVRQMNKNESKEI